MNGIILVDKPKDWTSHDVVAKLRGVLGERRIGHSGTLDPMATGLLAVFVGRATRAVEFAEGHDKEYIASVRFGISTDTQDITGTIVKKTGIIPQKEQIIAVLSDFRGEIFQTPPMYSALKVNGKKLYELARDGKEIERKSRKIEIKELELLGEDENGDFSFRVACTKGTYIRTLFNDIGEKLGCGATLTALRRTRAGEYSCENAHTLDEIIKLKENGETEGFLLPVESLFSSYPDIKINAAQCKKCLCGTSFPIEAEDGEYRVFDEFGAFLMLGTVKNGVMSTVKSFFEV